MGLSSTLNLCICVCEYLCVCICHCLCHFGASVDCEGHGLSENIWFDNVIIYSGIPLIEIFVADVWPYGHRNCKNWAKMKWKIKKNHLREPSCARQFFLVLIAPVSKNISKHCQRHNGPRILSPKPELSLKAETNYECKFQFST